jgi:hypothetical protein
MLVEVPTSGATAPPLSREAAGQSAHRVFGPNRADMAKSDIALAREIEQHHIDRKRELERITSRAYRVRKAARREAEKEAS